MPTYTADAKITRQRDGEGSKEKPEGRTLPLVGHSVTRERAWSKGK